jgi:hypothetical protein
LDLAGFGANEAGGFHTNEGADDFAMVDTEVAGGGFGAGFAAIEAASEDVFEDVFGEDAAFEITPSAPASGEPGWS